MESQYITAEQLSEMVKAGQNGRFLKTYADELGVSYQFLSKVLKGLCGPGDQIAKSLGYEQISVFRKVPEGTITAETARRAVNAISPAKKKAEKKRVVGPKKGQYRVVRAGKKKAAKKPSVKPKKRATPRKAKK